MRGEADSFGIEPRELGELVTFEMRPALEEGSDLLVVCACRLAKFWLRQPCELLRELFRHMRLVPPRQGRKTCGSGARRVLRRARRPGKAAAGGEAAAEVLPHVVGGRSRGRSPLTRMAGSRVRHGEASRVVVGPLARKSGSVTRRQGVPSLG
jgi:hypothetical protein